MVNCHNQKKKKIEKKVERSKVKSSYKYALARGGSSLGSIVLDLGSSTLGLDLGSSLIPLLDLRRHEISLTTEDLDLR